MSGWARALRFVAIAASVGLALRRSGPTAAERVRARWVILPCTRIYAYGRDTGPGRTGPR